MHTHLQPPERVDAGGLAERVLGLGGEAADGSGTERRKGREDAIDVWL